MTLALIQSEKPVNGEETVMSSAVSPAPASGRRSRRCVFEAHVASIESAITAAMEAVMARRAPDRLPC